MCYKLNGIYGENHKDVAQQNASEPHDCGSVADCSTTIWFPQVE